MPQLDAPADDSLSIVEIHPESLALGATRPMVRIIGHNFGTDAQVLLDGTPRETEHISENLLMLRLATSDFAAPGAVSLVVESGGKKSNVKDLSIESSTGPTGPWSFLGWTLMISPELRLFLLVLFTGAFGAAVAALQSLGDYRGRRKLVASWAMFYIVRPPVGAGVALIFYLVLRGGFLAGTDVDVGTTTPFGIVAVAALAGMFSDRAYQKLSEVARNLFRTEGDTRGETLAGLAIKTTTLGAAVHTVAYDAQLAAQNGTPPYAWSVDPALPANLVLDQTTGHISGTPTAAAAKKTYTFKVTDGTGTSAIAKIEFEVT